MVLEKATNDLGYSVILREELGYFEGKRLRRTIWLCPYYNQWKAMLSRCYDVKFLKKNPSYVGVLCSDSWLLASEFKSWMEQQDWVGKQLDKDILVFGNRLYSRDTCAFVTKLTNNFVLDSKASRGIHPIGVNLHKATGKFVAQCRNPWENRQEHLGLFHTPEEAHEAWRKRKHELAQLVAATESDPRVVGALKKRYSPEEWYKNNPISS